MPIYGATVSIDGKVMARTNSEGYFKTERFRIGTREFTFAAQGYSPERYYVVFREEGLYQLKTTGNANDDSFIFLFQLKDGETRPVSVYDLDGLGTVTINANQQIDKLLLIPYNVSMTDGEYSATLTITIDSGETKTQCLLDSSPVEKQMMIVSAENEKEAFYQRLREKELEAIRAQLGREVPFGVSKELLSGSNLPKEEMEFYKIIGEDYGVPVTATRINDSTKSCIYLDNELRSTITLEDIKGLSDTFDQYYDLLVEAFAPVGMDVDVFPGIYYVLTELENYGTSYVGGYFWGGNEFPRDLNDQYLKYSNEKEILFLTTYRDDKTSPTEWVESVKSTMAHELQHLINYTNRVPRIQNNSQWEQYVTETWINEGLSMVAEDLVFGGHNPDLDKQRVIPYLNEPALDSLCTWNIDPKKAINNYPPAYMFMRYFVDRFGSVEKPIIKELINSDGYGLDSLVFASGGKPFTSLFRDWLTAVYVGCQDESQKNGFETYDYYTTFNLYTINQDLENRLAITYNLPASLFIPDTTGVFISQEGLSSASEITVSISGFGSSQFKLRLLMFPSEGSSFKIQLQLQKLR
jgi:hypothetical protein